MTTVTCYAPTDMDATCSMPTGIPTITATTATLLQATIGAYVVSLYGNYTYNPLGQLTGGTLTGYDVALGLALEGSVRGLSIDVISLITNSAALTDAAIFSGNDTFNGSSGADVLRGYNGNDILNGNAGNDALRGEAGNDTLNGGNGNDILNGGIGADNMTGGSGNDIYHVDNVGDIVTETSTLATEIDKVFSSINYVLGNNIENLALTGAAAINGSGNALNNTITGNAANNVLNGLAGSDLLIGEAGNDALNGGDGNDTLNGGLGNDILNGGIGNDTLIGGWGIDAFAGGAGNDTYFVDQPIDSGLSIFSNAFNYVAQSQNWTFTQGSWSVGLSDRTGDGIVDGISIQYNDPLSFKSFSLQFTCDRLGKNLAAGTYLNTTSPAFGTSGTAGLDFSMNGSAGTNNTGSFSIQSLVINYSGATPVLQNLTATFSQLSITDTAPLTGTLNYAIQPAEQITELANQGVDLIVSPVSYTLPANIENLTLTDAAINGTGNSVNNIIIGNGSSNTLNGGQGNDNLRGEAGADTLNGGLGADTMSGGIGDDTYVVDNTLDVVIEVTNREIDEVVSSVSYVLPVNVEYLTLNGMTAVNGTGNIADNRLTGNAANNVLNGGLGADWMGGMAGNDTYVVDNANDMVFEFAAQGTDTVLSSISFTLWPNIENLTLTGTAAINGTGNTLNNTITGNAAANILIGGAGKDTLTGGLGADRFHFGATGDTGINSTTWDVITDFKSSEQDKIDLSAIDANVAAAGNQAFSFIGVAAFSGVNATGQLRFDSTAKVLYGSTDADNAAEFAIALNGVVTLTAADILL